MESELDRLRKKVENYPSPSAYTRLAELLRQGGDNAAAEDVCRRSAREFPRNGACHLIMASMAFERGDQHGGVEHLDRAAAAEPRSIDVHLALAEHLTGLKDLRRAAQHLHTVLALKPGHEEAIRRLGQLGPDFAPRQQSQSSAARAAIATAAEAGGFRRKTETVDLTGMGGALSSAGTTPIAPVHRRPTDILGELCAEPGVKGAVVHDAQGRTVLSHGIGPGSDDVLAALAGDVAQSATGALQGLRAGQLRTWSVVTGSGQVVAFRRDGGLTLVAIADREIKLAMLELRARQALIDLGGG